MSRTPESYALDAWSRHEDPKPAAPRCEYSSAHVHPRNCNNPGTIRTVVKYGYFPGVHFWCAKHEPDLERGGFKCEKPRFRVVI